MTYEAVQAEAERLKAEVAELLERKERLNDSVEEIKRLSESLEDSIAQVRAVSGVNDNDSGDTGNVLDG